MDGVNVNFNIKNFLDMLITTESFFELIVQSKKRVNHAGIF
jgi:hypothetical protein